MSDLNYVYEEEATTVLKIPASNYVITIGNDPSDLNVGIKQNYFSEIRFWKRYRSMDEIVTSQFH